MRIRGMLAAAGALVVAACGGGTTAETSSDVAAMQAYQALGQDVSSTVATYQADTAVLPDDATCLAAHEAYAARMATMLARMAEMSATMDARMAEYGVTAPRDTACVAQVMAAEFERHHLAACAAVDVTADGTEAAAHVAAMGSFVEHQRIRYQGTGYMMGMLDPTAETTWTCQRNADGTFTIDGEPWTPGTPLPGTGGTTGTGGTDGATTEPWPMPCGGENCWGCGGDGSGGMGGGMWR